MLGRRQLLYDGCWDQTVRVVVLLAGCHSVTGDDTIISIGVPQSSNKALLPCYKTSLFSLMLSHSLTSKHEVQLLKCRNKWTKDSNDSHRTHTHSERPHRIWLTLQYLSCVYVCSTLRWMYVTAQRSSRRTAALEDSTGNERDEREWRRFFFLPTDTDNACGRDTNILLKYSLKWAWMMKPTGSQRKLLLI